MKTGSAMLASIVAWCCSLIVVSCMPAQQHAVERQERKPTFTVSKTTTFVTEPVHLNGYVNFASAINARLKQGVNGENNACLPLYQAIGPISYQRDVSNWLWGPIQIEAFVQKMGASPDFFSKQSALDELRPSERRRAHFQVYKHPDPRFDEVFRLLHAAAERDRYYAPLITIGVGDGRPRALLGASYPSDIAIRSAAELLLTRASVLNDRESAWQDILASYRLGRLVGMGPEIEDAQLGMQIEQLSIAAAMQHITQHRPDAKALLKYREDLGNLPARSPVSGKVNLAERCKCLDSLLYQSWYIESKSVKLGSDSTWQGFSEINQLVQEQGLREADWDPAFIVVNKSFDEMVRILNLENIKDRRKALDERKRAWKETRDPYTPPQRGEFSALNPWEMTPEFLERMETLVWLQRRLNSLAKSDDGSGKLDAETEANAMREVGLAAATMLEPVYVRAFSTEQRTRQSALNLEIVLGLAAFHADKQRYPEQLADLKPKYLHVAPVDLFSGEALVYRLEDNGCLFYSVGENERDDDGMLDQRGSDDLGVRLDSPTEQ